MPALNAAALRGLQRFGLGLCARDIDQIGDPRATLLHEAERREAPLVKAPGLETSTETARKALAYVKQRELKKREMVRAAAAGSAAADAEPRMAPAADQTNGSYPQRVYCNEVVARFGAAQARLGGYGERLVQFWSNHFCVSGIKANFVLALAGPFEREVIRPHVFGRFEDMLLAVETHPAMLYYLDNERSVGPNSPGGKRIGHGLNENLAREILELHTLGAQGGYTQADVEALARIITGWTFSRGESPGVEAGGFFFNANLHEPGPQTLLGRVYSDDGVAQGKRALLDLAHHPSTAEHIALKLARWFVADEPPPALVALLAQTFRKTDGDLGAVSAALISSDAAWTAPAVKLRTPQEFIVAATRALGRTFDYEQIGIALRGMGQPLWQPRGPNGYPSDVADLMTPNALQARLDAAAQWAHQASGGVDDPREWTGRMLGALASDETRSAVAQAESPQQAIALMLMSPEFQRR
jgi:uncharacterized protein (DUF1800 family)